MICGGLSRSVCPSITAQWIDFPRLTIYSVSLVRKIFDVARSEITAGHTDLHAHRSSHRRSPATRRSCQELRPIDLARFSAFGSVGTVVRSLRWRCGIDHNHRVSLCSDDGRTWEAGVHAFSSSYTRRDSRTFGDVESQWLRCAYSIATISSKWISSTIGALQEKYQNHRTCSFEYCQLGWVQELRRIIGVLNGEVPSVGLAIERESR